MAWRLVCVLIVALGALAPTAAQTPSKSPHGLLAGIVVASDTGRPIAGAIVEIAGPTSPGTTAVMTGVDGRFAFPNQRAGVFTLAAAKAGMIPAGGTLGRVVELFEDQRISDIRLPLSSTGSIGGTVVDELGDPVVGAHVMALARRLRQTRMVWMNAGNAAMTDDRGMYRLSNLPPDEYVLVIRSTSSSVPVDVANAYQSARDVQIDGVAKPSPLSLTLIGGVPGLMGGDARARAVDGQIQFLPTSTLLPATDAKGRNTAYVTTYFPSTRDLATATAIQLESGERRLGVDFTLQRAVVATVAGTVSQPGGVSAMSMVSLLARDGSPGVFPSDPGLLMTMTDSRGAFRFLGVPSGDYILRVAKVPSPAAAAEGPALIDRLQLSDGTSRVSRLGSPTASRSAFDTTPTLYVETSLHVGVDDVTGLSVLLAAAPTVSGRILFNGASPKPSATTVEKITVSIASELPGGLMGQFPRAAVDAAGNISSQGFPPGPYSVAASSPPGWALESIAVGRVDVSERGLTIGQDDITNLVITYTDQPTELMGTVLEGPAAGAAVDGSVIVFPSATRPKDGELLLRRTQMVAVGARGSYVVKNLPPGDYCVVAVPGAPRLSPQLLAGLEARAAHISLSRGDRRTQDLVVLKTLR